ncbi:uncharacterized protein LOC135197475 [Macrobrachium nipponense]|uniref:uncharacterized protein LOC135197475 n=1 Tax=Macrobrachium nipponense TaxID=159736 RepID=UPI0030C7A2A5
MDPAFSCEFCGIYMGDPDKEPRVLCCGHTFCTPCVCDFFRGGKYKCPSCSRQHHPENTEAIPINHSLLKMIRTENSPGGKKSKRAVSSPGLSKNGGTKSDSETETDLPVVNPGSSEEPLHHAGKCDKHDTYCTFWCKKCKEWICHDCTIIGHPPAQCSICSFTQAVEEMKMEEDLCIKRTIELFDAHAEKYHEKQWALKALREKHRALIKELQRLLSKHQRAKKDIERQAEAIKSCLTDGLTTLLTMLESQGRLLEAQTLQEVLEARHQAQICQSKILAWHDPAILAETEEIYYSEELQNSTSIAFAVLRHTLPSSDNSSIKSPSSDFTTLSTEDEAEVARNIKYLMESPEWKRIVEKRENDDLATDNSWWHCLAKGSGKTDTRKDELDRGLNNSYNKMGDQQLEIKSPSPRKRSTPIEDSIDKCKEDSDDDCRCSLPHKQHLAYDDLKGLVYPSRSTYPVAKRRASLSPKLDQISENEELVEGLTKEPRKEELVEGLTEEPRKHVEEKGLDYPQIPTRRRIGFTGGDSKQIGSLECLQRAGITIPSTKGITFTETDTKTPDASIPAVASEPTYPEQEGSSRENSLLGDSRNELHLFYYANGGFENAPETDFGSHECGTDKGHDRKSDSGKDVVGISAPAGNDTIANSAPAGSESVGNSALAGNESVGNSALAGNDSDGNTASGNIIVVAGEADEDDDNEGGNHYYDSDYLDDNEVSDGGYECDAIHSSVSEERECGTEQMERKFPNNEYNPHGSSLLAECQHERDSSKSTEKTTISNRSISGNTERSEGSYDGYTFVNERGEIFRSVGTEPTSLFNNEPPGDKWFHLNIIKDEVQVVGAVHIIASSIFPYLDVDFKKNLRTLPVLNQRKRQPFTVQVLKKARLK